MSEPGLVSGEPARQFIENNGSEVVQMSDGERSAFPMDTADALAALDALEARLSRAEYVEEAARTLLAMHDRQPVPGLIGAASVLRAALEGVSE